MHSNLLIYLFANKPLNQKPVMLMVHRMELDLDSQNLNVADLNKPYLQRGAIDHRIPYSQKINDWLLEQPFQEECRLSDYCLLTMQKHFRHETPLV